MNKWLLTALLLVPTLLVPTLLSAQETPSASTEPAAASSAETNAGSVDEIEKLKAIGVRFTEGPGMGALGSHAEIEVPAGHVLTDGDGSRTILKAFGNLTGSDEVGMLAPRNFEWFITFDFNPVGYVKDDEKDKLDADAMLKSITENNVEANKYRQKQGLPVFSIAGFAVPPRYNAETQNLEWAIKIRDDASGEESVNFNTKILGRRGVMVVTLVCDPSALDAFLPEFRSRMANFRYKSGEKYAEYRQGDQVAKYGLTALVVGGGVALAAKSGLLGKLLKPILVGLLVVVGGIKKLFGRGRQ